MSKHPQTQLTDLDVAVARAIHQQVELRWCHFWNPNSQNDKVDGIFTEYDQQYGGWNQQWCQLIDETDDRWDFVPCYSQDNHAALDALHQFCDKHGWDFEYICYKGHAERDDIFAKCEPGYVNPSPIVQWHWVRISPKIVERTERTFALAVAKCIERAAEWAAELDPDYAWTEHPPDPNELA